MDEYRDFFFKHYPFVIASAILWAFHYLCPGSRHLYSNAFKRVLHLQSTRVLTGVEVGARNPTPASSAPVSHRGKGGTRRHTLENQEASAAVAVVRCERGDRYSRHSTRLPCKPVVVLSPRSRERDPTIAEGSNWSSSTSSLCNIYPCAQAAVQHDDKLERDSSSLDIRPPFLADEINRTATGGIHTLSEKTYTPHATPSR